MALKYGFFHAHRSVDAQTGVATYDRAYNGDDINQYLEGIITQNGVYKESGQLTSTGARSACNVVIYDPNNPIQRVDDPDDLVDDEVERWHFVIKPGRGVIKSHWFTINSNYDVYIPLNASTSTAAYWKVALQCDENNRDIHLVVESCAGSDPTPIGWNNGVITTVDGKTEIVLASIRIDPGNNTYRRYDLRGNARCPWISHLVLKPGDKDADRFVSQYTEELLQWIAQIRDAGQLNQKLEILKLVLNGDDQKTNPAQRYNTNFDLTRRMYTHDGIIYNHEDGDNIMVYYNGLYLTEGIDYTVRIGQQDHEYNVPGVPDDNHVFLNVSNGWDNIPVGNILTVLVYIGNTVDVPNGNNIKY